MNFDLFKTNLLQSVQANDNPLVLKLLSEHSFYAHRWKDLITKNGDTVVHLAAHSGCVSIIKFYAENRSRVILEHKNLDGKTPLHIAAHSGQLECVKYLLSCGAIVDALKRSDWTPFMLACTKSNINVIKELLVHGANLSIANKDGWTAFHIASREGSFDIMQLLLKFHPLVWNTKSKNGRTPLHTACLHGHLDVVKFFLKHVNYEINVKDSCGITHLMDAVSGNHNQVVEFLVQKGALISELDKLGRNVLHLAAEAGNTNCIRYFVDCHHISVDSQSLQGLSPLHFACKENEIETFYALLELGANCYLKDNHGRTAFGRWIMWSTRKFGRLYGINSNNQALVKRRNTNRQLVISSEDSGSRKSNEPKILQSLISTYPTPVEKMEESDRKSTTAMKDSTLDSLTTNYLTEMEAGGIFTTTPKSIVTSTAETSMKNDEIDLSKSITETSPAISNGASESEKQPTTITQSATGTNAETSPVTNSI